jgi:hypothetical protein
VTKSILKTACKKSLFNTPGKSLSVKDNVTRLLDVRCWVPYRYDLDNKSADLVIVPMVNRLN